MTNPAGDGPTLGFSYDAMGDIETKTLNGTAETYTYAPNHPYAVSAVSSGGSQIYSASYDDDGNMLTRNGDPIQWTPSNLPSSISGSLGSSTFNYGPGHQRYYQAATLNGVITDTTKTKGSDSLIIDQPGDSVPLLGWEAGERYGPFTSLCCSGAAAACHPAREQS